jgi:hypothetical protein
MLWSNRATGEAQTGKKEEKGPRYFAQKVWFDAIDGPWLK